MKSLSNPGVVERPEQTADHSQTPIQTKESRMHLSKLLTAIALCVSAISAQAYPAQEANYDLAFQSEFKILQNDTPQIFKTLKDESTGANDGVPLILQHRWQSRILKTVTEGKN